MNPSGEAEVRNYVKALTGPLSPSVRLRVSAVERQRLRHPAQDLHTPPGQRSRASVSARPLIAPAKQLTLSPSAGQWEESELEAVHGGADLVFGQWGRKHQRVFICDHGRSY